MGIGRTILIGSASALSVVAQAVPTGAAPDGSSGVRPRRPITVMHIGLPNSGYGPSALSAKGHVAFSQVYDQELIGKASLWYRGELTELRPPAPFVRVPYAINDRGTIVGLQFDDYVTPIRAFVWSDGVLRLLGSSGDSSVAVDVNERDDVLLNRFPVDRCCSRASVLHRGHEIVSPDLPGGRSLHGAAINDRGQVAGHASSGNPGDEFAFFWKPRHQPVSLGTLGGSHHESLDINNAGSIVGRYTEGDAKRMFIWRDGDMADLGSLGGPGTDAELASSTPQQINERDQVTGKSQTPDGAYHAFLWTDGAMLDLGTLGGDYSYGVAVNDHGDVVGTSQTATGTESAFLWRDGQMIDLGALVPGSQLAMAHAINNRGQVLGRSFVDGQSDDLMLWETRNRG